MKNKVFLLLAFLGFGMTAVQAQQKTSMSLHDAVAMALEKSDEVSLANAKTATKKYELQTVKNNRYPDLKVSGQYMRLTNADIKQGELLKSDEETSGSAAATKKEQPKVNQLLLGQANLSMPIFSGFKLKNSIAASEKLYQSETANASYTKEETALQVIEYYAQLYKTQKAVELYKESLKRSQQRVTDFTAMEKNGIIARNDLLKSQLQVSKIQLSLDDAEKNVRLINYKLITLLKLPAETFIEVSPDNIDKNLFNNAVKSESEALQNRKDLQAVNLMQQAAESNIKVAKAGYYPSLSLSGGYIALDLSNVITVSNAMNVGVGLSYNLSSIFKNGDEVKAAKNRALEAQTQASILTDRIKTEIIEAQEEYNLSVKQDKVYNESVDQATENYRIVKDKYDNGLADTNDLLEADVDQLGAQVNQANAKANVALKYYELLNASGQLLQSFNFSQN
jgi:outer membrane protein